ncbi:MAG: hypothetical protein AM1032_000120 [Mycoplasmataceae bacterium]|nr:MAG: hypothetical protein AM1032_000120 [Mycoplasmataceae bacterium]
MNEYKDKEKSLRGLNEERTIIILKWLQLNNICKWEIEYLNNEHETKDLDLISDFQENINYLVNLKKLVISNNNNLKYLDLSKCVNLEYLFLRSSKIIEIKLPNENKIENLYISNNVELEKINLEVLNPKNLSNLTLSLNNKLELKIEIFSKFNNLENLYICNTNYSGSLIHLRKLTKLKNLSVSNSNIENNFEYLPDNVLIILNYSHFINHDKIINKFITRKNNILLKRDVDYDELFINVSEFKSKHPQLVKNAKAVIEELELFEQLEIDLLTILNDYKSKDKKTFTKFDHRFLMFTQQILFPWLKDNSTIEDRNDEAKKYSQLSSNYYSDLINEEIEIYPLI